MKTQDTTKHIIDTLKQAVENGKKKAERKKEIADQKERLEQYFEHWDDSQREFFLNMVFSYIRGRKMDIIKAINITHYDSSIPINYIQSMRELNQEHWYTVWDYSDGWGKNLNIAEEMHKKGHKILNAHPNHSK